ncbi:MAG: hypothetical protein IBX50_08535 [Marinospirillum sp.]|uniref:hypothetical protein n=1 Tax=Marinospirillum sp. TaxID=2183934 RepID=UPI0019DD8D95|nr:hypothetical protein [Marinospirillum sp.]MBE0506753.1 hypothetical protein [Marinospirillum sp.]
MSVKGSDDKPEGTNPAPVIPLNSNRKADPGTQPEKGLPDMDREAFAANKSLHIEGLKLVPVRTRRKDNPYLARPAPCRHLSLIFDPVERKVWCDDCESEVDSFDAFCIFAERLADIDASLKRKSEQLQQDQETHLITRAAKAIDKDWRSRSLAPLCPHCKSALMPEDLAGGFKAYTSIEIERARRIRNTEKSEPVSLQRMI